MRRYIGTLELRRTRPELMRSCTFTRGLPPPGPRPLGQLRPQTPCAGFRGATSPRPPCRGSCRLPRTPSARGAAADRALATAPWGGRSLELWEPRAVPWSGVRSVGWDTARTIFGSTSWLRFVRRGLVTVACLCDGCDVAAAKCRRGL